MSEDIFSMDTEIFRSGASQMREVADIYHHMHSELMQLNIPAGAFANFPNVNVDLSKMVSEYVRNHEESLAAQYSDFHAHADKIEYAADQIEQIDNNSF